MIAFSQSINKWHKAIDFGTVYGFEEAGAVMEVLSNGAPTNSKKVREFEKKFAAMTEAPYAIATNSWGGAAQALAIAMDFKPGDEVIVPAITTQASANLFIREGAKVVFAESHPRTFNLDPEKLEAKITRKTRCVLAVHLFGQPCEMDKISEICKKHNVILIQDAAHAVGAEYKNKKLGEFGDFTIFSFQYEKNISTLGEGGMIITSHKEWADTLKKIRNYGSGLYIGINARMTDAQAAVGIVQLDRLRSNNERRRQLAYYLNSRLSQIQGIITPIEIDDVYHVYHLYNIILEPEKINMSRDDFFKLMWKENKIATISYAPTVNSLPAFKNLGYDPDECPVSKDIASRMIALPISPRFSCVDMDELVSGVKKVIALRGK